MTAVSRERIPAGEVVLEGDLTTQRDARGLVVFAHGSGSSRFSSRNRFVAAVLSDAGLATLLIDLLTRAEERADARTGELRFDIDLLAARVAAAAAWARNEPRIAALRIGLFGASTGAGAALAAAAAQPDLFASVVSRGGRPDLAGAALAEVRVPTLLIVGGRDTPVIEMNEDAFARMKCEKQLEIVGGATHLFEEPGALEQVAHLARDWFLRTLAPSAGL